MLDTSPDGATTSTVKRAPWRFWELMWRPERRATYALAVCATDGAGAVQTAVVHGAETEGATGLDRLMLNVV